MSETPDRHYQKTGTVNPKQHGGGPKAKIEHNFDFFVTPKSVTISRKANRWFVSFKVETIPQITKKSVDVVGVDLGVISLATLSTVKFLLVRNLTKS